MYNISFIPFRSCLEDLENEVSCEIFKYMDIYHVYERFFNLNRRFKNLLMHSNKYFNNAKIKFRIVL